MSQLALAPEIVDAKLRRNAVERMRELNVALPTLSQLADPDRIPARHLAALAGVDPDEPRAANLWRVHWFNDEARTGRVDVPGYLVLPEALTGVKARIVVALGGRFPMIGAHKVLAAYGCLVPRLVTGRFDPTLHKRDLAVDGELLPRRRGDLAHSRLPRRGRFARGHEPGALYVARALGGGSNLTSSARRGRKATSRKSTTSAPCLPATRRM